MHIHAQHTNTPTHTHATHTHTHTPTHTHIEKKKPAQPASPYLQRTGGVGMATPVVGITGRGARVAIAHVTRTTATVNAVARLGLRTLGVLAAVAVLVLTAHLTCVSIKPSSSTSVCVR